MKYLPSCSPARLDLLLHLVADSQNQESPPVNCFLALPSSTVLLPHQEERWLHALMTVEMGRIVGVTVKGHSGSHSVGELRASHERGDVEKPTAAEGLVREREVVRNHCIHYLDSQEQLQAWRILVATLGFPARRMYQ